ncbi:hypothetical protein FNO01nite_27090 [Flavobacterium noncentrifugens]|uniref:Por secretion system C-terminal sorting domain-containing protein n=1 Tax=Flavobacterium noncentrifugens TaxID=1128970 RepID=A0A1G9CHH5_9FLAO|nr:CRTAC1 family protein [Flavobacterium noncentrifugens]GEP52037.1 hypothetical protein FNO01nite_27090 [Flavobacterium noncentrifugens]SDK51109.1 Por secretion system C-terminal sorting domain-containing protein [Flavobacterium noncentrifugens]
MKKITLLFAFLFVAQIASAQESCANAAPITGSGTYTITSFTGTQPPQQNCTPTGGSPAALAEWYVYTPTQNHTITITTDIVENSPRRDTRLHVFVGDCGNLTCYSGDDDSGINFSSTAVFDVTANTTYHFAFDNRWNSLTFKFKFIEGEVVVPIAPPVAFVEQPLATAQVGNNKYNNCVVDMNNDYLDDIVGTTGNNIRIHYQNADGTFTQTNIPTATAENTAFWSIAAGDYNKDGYNDLLYGGGNGLTLMESNATGTAFTKHTPGQYIFCQRTNFIDINNDGNLDAFSCHDVEPNVYYINNAAGGFTYYQSGAAGALNLGITSTGGNYASLWTDYDNDGDVDLFISKCSGPPCELHRNNGDGTFTDVSAAAHINVTPIQSWSSAVADFDNDGDMDIMIGSNGSTKNILFRNDLDENNKMDIAFTNVSDGSGLETDGSTSRDYIAYDFDNDGLVDIMGGGYKIFYNQGNMRFSTVSYPGMALGAVGDFNNDGFLDIQSSYEAPYSVKLYMNSGNANNWITINTKGTQSNTNGIAARVEIYGAWGKQIRDVRSGEGFEFMSTLNTHFGIGSATHIDKIIIRWPSGIVDTFNNPPINHPFMAVEGSTLAVSDFANAAFSIYPNPANDVLYIKAKDKAAAFKSAEIFDMAGREVSNTVVTDQPISVKNLSSGSYIILLKDADGKRFTQKFLKK